MSKVLLHLVGEGETIREAAQLLAEKLNVEFTEDGIRVQVVSGAEALRISRQEGCFVLEYSQRVEAFRGLALIVDMIRKDRAEEVLQKRYFDTCGMMLDVSRGRVITVETAKDLLEYMALMGLNMMMLYTEDTYEIEKYPQFGYKKGAYTKEEIRAVDAYAQQFGIELIPCIQTLSHLKTALRWGYAGKFKDTAETLYVGKDETYEFIRDMFTTVKECFTSRRIHIGLDEAADVGSGKKRKLDGYIPPFTLLTQHLEKVCEIAREEGLSPMMWSDMFFKFGQNGGDYDSTSVIPEGFSEVLPDNIEMVYWDYCFEDGDTTDLFLKKHNCELGRKTIFAGGIWTWNRMTVNLDKTFATANGQLASCKKNGVKEVFATIWCNTASMFNLYSILPGLQMWAEHMYREKVEEKQLADMFECCTGYSMEAFRLLSMDDFTEEDKAVYQDPAAFCINTSAQLFFNDILTGLWDKTLSGFDFKTHYGNYLDRIDALGDMGKMKTAFTQAKILAQILIIKSDIKKELMEAYEHRCQAGLEACEKRMEELLGLYERYHEISMEIWHQQNKPFGWDTCDMMIGNAETRVKTAIKRVQGLLEGRVECLPELETETFYYYENVKPLTESAAFGGIISVMN